MTAIYAYLTFDGNCREAMTFYKNCLGGELNMLSVDSSPMADRWPASAQKNILHASLTKENLVLLGSDMIGPEGVIDGNIISLSLNCSSHEEAGLFFSKLSAGGKIIQPLHYFFNGTIGVLLDKFGINWLLYYGQEAQV